MHKGRLEAFSGGVLRRPYHQLLESVGRRKYLLILTDPTLTQEEKYAQEEARAALVQ